MRNNNGDIFEIGSIFGCSVEVTGSGSKFSFDGIQQRLILRDVFVYGNNDSAVAIVDKTDFGRRSMN
jgi:hypothetical protein